MPFMALMAAPLSAMLSVTGGDGSLDYPSHTRARTADNLFWRHHVSPTRAGGWGSPPSRRAVQREHHRRDRYRLRASCELSSQGPRLRCPRHIGRLDTIEGTVRFDPAGLHAGG